MEFLSYLPCSNQINLGNGIWGIYSGDFNQDENIDLIDILIQENDISNFVYGYSSSDINGDGNVDLLDSPLTELNVTNFIYSAHP